jgi:hypothetical protein
VNAQLLFDLAPTNSAATAIVMLTKLSLRARLSGAFSDAEAVGFSFEFIDLPYQNGYPDVTHTNPG